jgi:hypothetical protein
MRMRKKKNIEQLQNETTIASTPIITFHKNKTPRLIKQFLSRLIQIRIVFRNKEKQF